MTILPMAGGVPNLSKKKGNFQFQCAQQPSFTPCQWRGKRAQIAIDELPNPGIFGSQVGVVRRSDPGLPLEFGIDGTPFPDTKDVGCICKSFPSGREPLTDTRVPMPELEWCFSSAGRIEVVIDFAVPECWRSPC